MSPRQNCNSMLQFFMEKLKLLYFVKLQNCDNLSQFFMTNGGSHDSELQQRRRCPHIAAAGHSEYIISTWPMGREAL